MGCKVFHTTVSIHAPTWGATSYARDASCISCFNPRTHMGCDRRCRPPSRRLSGFNPRTHMGCDLMLGASASTVEFQSTHPHGVRLEVVKVCICSVGFQSTHPHGVRPPGQQGLQGLQGVSIHAPTWGATSIAYTSRLRVICFNPRTHMGCDLEIFFVIIDIIGVSIHAPTWGATGMQWGMLLIN